MKLATGVLLWTPEEFWQATMTEFVIASTGYREANDPESTKPSMDHDRLEQMMVMFPD